MTAQKSVSTPRLRLRAEMRAFVAEQPGQSEDAKIDAAVAALSGFSPSQVRVYMGRQASAATWLPGSTGLRTFCRVTGVRPDYLLFGDLPRLRAHVRQGSWTEDFCVWLLGALDRPPESQVDTSRVLAFVVAAVRAAESSDQKGWRAQERVISLAMDLLAQRATGDAEQRAIWQRWLDEAEAVAHTGPRLDVLIRPIFSRDGGADGILTKARPVPTLALMPLPDFEIVLGPPHKLDVRSRATKTRKA